MKSIVMVVLLFAIITVFQEACGGITPTPDPIPPPTCTEVCAWWSLHGCIEGESTPNRAPCTEWCAKAVEISAFAARFECILSSANCESSRQCE